MPSKVPASLRAKRVIPNARKLLWLNSVTLMYILFIIGYISYAVGSNYYLGYVTFVTPQILEAEKFIKVVCIANSTICGIGLMCGIIGVRRRGYVFLFILCHASINIASSVIGNRKTEEALGSFPKMKHIIDMVKHDKYRNMDFLIALQLYENCCGLMGFWDYAAFLSVGLNQSTQIIQVSKYIDGTCCHFDDKLEECSNSIDIPLGKNNIPRNISNLIKLYNCELTPLNPDREMALAEINGIYSRINGKFIINPKANEHISICGCYNKLFEYHNNIYNVAHSFFLMGNYIVVLWIGILFNHNVTKFQIYQQNKLESKSSQNGSNNGKTNTDSTSVNYFGIIQPEPLSSTSKEKYSKATIGGESQSKRSISVKNPIVNSKSTLLSSIQETSLKIVEDELQE